MLGNSHNDPQRKCSPGAKRLHDEAKSKGMCLYDPQYHRWYSPEEFIHSFGNAFNDLTEFFNRIQVRDPVDGINVANQRITNLLKQLEIFTKRVLEYFRKA